MAIIDRAVGDDSVLMASASAGDEVAFAAIVLAYHEDMRRVCVAVAGDETVADDAVGAAWAIAWRKLGSVRDPSAFDHGLCRSPSTRPVSCFARAVAGRSGRSAWPRPGAAAAGRIRHSA